MTDSPEKRRVDEYLETINRLEPNISHIDASAFYASAAISLKRIADVLESFELSHGAHFYGFNKKWGT